MEFKLPDRTKITVDIYGTKHVISKPTTGQMDIVYADFDKQGVEQRFQNSKSLLVSVGLKKDVVDSIEMDHMDLLIERLMGQEKKS